MKESSKLIISLACLTQLMHLLLRAFVLHWDVFLLFLNRGVLESQNRRWLFLDAMLCADCMFRCCELAFLFFRSSKFVRLRFESMLQWRPFLGKAGRWLLLFFVVYWLGMAQPRLYVSDSFKSHPGYVRHQSLCKRACAP